MKKKSIYILCLIAFIVAVGAVIFNYNKKEEEKEKQVFALLPRKGSAAKTEEWAEVQKQAQVLIAATEANPDDTKSALKLAALYIQEARETGNYMYYDMAAMKYVNNVLAKNPEDFNALVFKSLIYLSQHHFAEGLQVAQMAQKVNPNNAYVYGLLVDGYVEMGKYDSAVASSDKMVSIRPDLTSYSRVSYLREIFGNYRSSIEAMKMAAEAGGRADEHTEWTRVQLGALYEKTGEYKTADSLYNVSLALRPNYPYAIAGLGRVALATGDYNKAISYFEQADSLITDHSIKEELVDVYRLAGQTQKADELANKIIEELSEDAEAGDKDETIGHYADRELAYAYLKVNKPDKALEHAMLEYNRRPDNIDVNETVAWVYYNKGEYAKAIPYIKAALKTNSKNPLLLSRAGMIFYKAGEKQLAKSILQQASVTNSYIGSTLKAETAAAMQNM
jgi:tetratricopeptide (TPR) repeat protein